jgi:hypothetical protein
MQKKKYLLTILFLSSCYFAFAQGPGTDCVPDQFDPCPLDTWVIILVIAATVFTVIHLKRKQKSLQV